MDTWRTWELVLPALGRRHEVLALTLPGHAGGPPLGDDAGVAPVLEAVERAIDAAGFATAHLVGNSLGGYLALRLAERGRADSVVAFAPAGGWADGDASLRTLLEYQREMQAAVTRAAPFADAPELLVHQMLGVARCTDAPRMIDAALRDGYPLQPERIECPVRIVWGTADELLPWPAGARRFREQWLPHADWIELDGVGHAPQLEVPLEAAQLILGFTSP